MQMITVQRSTNVARFGYDAETRRLVVEFSGRTRYAYRNVPQFVFDELARRNESGESVGGYLRQQVTHNEDYPFEKLEREPVAENA
jgi:hypothetical protein